MPVSPALAQKADRVLIIFGNDKCPTNASGDEIVVCARRPEAERYRIPKEFRSNLKSPDSQSWAVRSQSALSTGRTGAGSCSAVGAGGWTGCWAEQMRAAKAEGKAEAAAERDVP
jgi:hypothetical protein